MPAVIPLRRSLARFSLALALLVCAASARAQIIQMLPVVRDDDRVTVTIRTLSDGVPAQRVAVGWSVSGAQAGDRLLSDVASVTDASGLASFSLALAPTPGTRQITANVNSFEQSVTFVIDQSSFLKQQGLAVYQSLANVAIDGARTQLRNVSRRIRERRGGGPAVSIFGNGLRPTFDGAFATGLVSQLQAAAEPVTGPGSRFGVFVNGQASSGAQDTTANVRGYDARTLGLTGGADYRISDNFIIGGALGLLRVASDFEGAAADSQVQGVSLSGFSTWYLKDFYLDAVASYGRNWYDTTRNVGAGATAAGSTRGTQLAASLSSGWGMQRGALSFGPYVRLAAIHVEVDEFSETGSSGANLQVSKQSADSFTTALGVQASYAMSTRFGVLSPQARLEWEQEHRQDVRLLSGTLVSDPLKTPFAVPSDAPDRSYVNLGLGVAAQLAAGKAAYISYEGVFGRNGYSNHAVVLGGRIDF